MNFKDPLFSRFKKPMPCFLCNASVRNYENFCAKCKKSVMSKCPSPAPKLPKKVSEERSKIFHIRPISPISEGVYLKETACFNDPSSLSKFKDRSYIEKSHNKEISIDLLSFYSKRPQSSLEVNLGLKKPSYKKLLRKKQKVSEKPKIYKISKSPIPELRPQSQLARSVESSYGFSQLYIADSYSLHRSTLTDICLKNDKIWTVGLDYQITCNLASNFSQLYTHTGHSRGILHTVSYKDILVTSGRDGKIKYWNNQNCTFQSLSHKGGVTAISSNTNFLLTANNSIKLWTDTSLIHEYQENSIKTLLWINSNTFVTGTKKNLKLWDCRAQNPISLFPTTGHYYSSTLWDENSFFVGMDRGIQVKNM